MSRRPRNRPPDAAPSWTAPDAAGAFGGFIGPRNLVALVRSTAPYLFDDARWPAPPDVQRLHERAFAPLGWRALVRHGEALPATDDPTPEQVTDYFALCVAAHFSTVATFVPTDVDTKIRDHLWTWRRTPDELARQRALALALATWDVSSISARIVKVDELGPVSGHDGERLSVLAGGLLGHLHAGDAKGAAELEAAIAAELSREAAAFERLARAPGRERDLLILAASIVHNAGDVDQGLSAGVGEQVAAAARERFGRLAHERPERFGGAFRRANALYKELMAAEGHRHYPLRETKALRVDPALLLPVGPFFDGWGETLARFPGWTPAQRAEALAAVINGTQRVKGQEGYYRALAGFDRVYPRGLDAPDLSAHLPGGARRALKDPELRKKVAVRQESFEASIFKRARAILART